MLWTGTDRACSELPQPAKGWGDFMPPNVQLNKTYCKVEF